LYRRYADHLRSLAAAQSSPALAARVDPDDIVQSVFRTFFRRVCEDRYDVPAGDDLWRLFLVIALHKIRNAAIHHRAAKRDVRQTVPIGGDARRAGAADGDATGLAVLRMVIDDALARLPDGTRRIVQLRVEGYEVAEIAGRVGRSKRSVERVLQQFRDELKGLLDEDR
jgi:RNA polymerase sigma-70 factor (ECF subfamily)